MEKKLFKIVQENIKMILKCMGMSQAELSKRIKKDPATIHRWIKRRL